VFSSLPFLHATPESLVRKLTDLPPAPKVLHTLQRLLATTDIALGDVAEVVTLEPGLSAKVVRMANSTHFGRGAHVEEIMEAIQRVGMNGVQELVTFAVASQLVGRPLSIYGLDPQVMWARAVACAIAASSLAERSDSNRTEAYTAGLMHGLGLVVIDKHASRQWPPRRRRIASAGYPLDYAPEEREWLGFSHAEAGAALLELWGFSEAVTTAVRYQLAPEEAPAHRQLSMILATARWARSLFCVPEENIPELPTEVWLAEAGVEISDFGEWLRKVRIRIALASEELRLG
jgi:HD-like signal output (HDOD) protein